MAIRAPGLVCIRLYYRQFGRLATMTFYGEGIGPQGVAVCKAATEALGLWEDTGEVIPFGYALLRSNDSHFVDCRAWSLDPSSRASYVSGPFNRRGYIPTELGGLMATTLAPLIYWDTSPERRIRGRTYAVGLADTAVTSGADAQKLTALFEAGFVDEFQRLRGLLLDHAGLTQVLVTTRSRGAPVDPALTFPVTGCTASSGLIGSQRRRTWSNAPLG